MLICIKDIPEGHSTIEQNVSMTKEQLRDGYFSGDVFCHADIDRNNLQIYLSIKYSCKVVQECSRCLDQFTFPIEDKFRLILVKREKKMTSFNESQEDSFDYTFSEYDKIVDIRQSIYEEVMINLPIQPLCSINCKGINYNHENQQKSEKDIDPRWDALKKINKNMH